MDLTTAIGVLGLAWDFTRDDVLKAYKTCMLQSHPDKNPDPGSTARAQRINEAKDYLMGRAYFAESERKEAKQRWEEQEVENDIKKVRDWLQEMELATEEAKQQFETWFKDKTKFYFSHMREHVFNAWFEVSCEYHDKRKALQRRQRYNANLKKKRPEGSRAHRKTSGYKEGRATLAQVAEFLQENIQASAGSRLMASDVRKRYVETRKDASALELSLFNRHYKRLLLGQFPGAFYCRFKLQRSFAEVALK